MYCHYVDCTNEIDVVAKLFGFIVFLQRTKNDNSRSFLMFLFSDWKQLNNKQASLKWIEMYGFISYILRAFLFLYWFPILVPRRSANGFSRLKSFTSTKNNQLVSFWLTIGSLENRDLGFSRQDLISKLSRVRVFRQWNIEMRSTQ